MEFAKVKVEDIDEVENGSKTSSSAFYSTENTVDCFHKCIGIKSFMIAH